MAEISETAENFFVKDRGEREYYRTAAPTDTIRLPVTRDGFECLLDVVASQFSPPLPVNDSMRSVLAGYVHHIKNEENTSTIESLAKVLFKSVSNALTWTIDQEVKRRKQDEVTKFQLEQKAIADEEARKKAVEAAADKRQKKASKKVTMTGKRKANEASTN